MSLPAGRRRSLMGSVYISLVLFVETKIPFEVSAFQSLPDLELLLEMSIETVELAHFSP
jgi:hypothetical protein